MKKTVLIIAALLVSFSGMAQQNKMMFPFKGGLDEMTKFFKDSVAVSPDIIQKKANGVVIFKFTADARGDIQKMIIFYADDYLLTQPLIAALKKSNQKWLIPDGEKIHDFIIQFSVNFNAPAVINDDFNKAVYNFHKQRHPILTYNQVPLETATLLPSIQVNYDLP